MTKYKKGGLTQPLWPKQWIPVKIRELTEEDKVECPYARYMLDCKMPYDGEKILVTLRTIDRITGKHYVAYAEHVYDDGASTEQGYDWYDDIIAWMPLPDPYEEVCDDGTD